MNISEAHIEFKFRYDKLDGFNYPNYEPEEIDLILNQAQQRLIKQRYGITNLKRESFEETQKRTEDLRHLIVDVNLTPSINVIENITTNAVFILLPTDHWFIIQERAIIFGPKCNDNLYNEDTPDDEKGTPYTIIVGKYCEVRPVQHVDIDKILNDPFKSPNYDKILRLMYQNKVELIPSSVHTIVKYKMRYIRKPLDVSFANNIDPELPDHLLTEWIDEAVVIALEGVESKRNNTFTPLINNSKE